MVLPTYGEFLIPDRQLVTIQIEGGITGEYDIKYIDDTELREWMANELRDFINLTFNERHYDDTKSC